MKKYFIKDDGTIKLTNMLILIGILFFIVMTFVYLKFFKVSLEEPNETYKQPEKTSSINMCNDCDFYFTLDSLEFNVYSEYRIDKYLEIKNMSLNNIKFEFIDTYTKVEKEYPYNDKLYFNFLENEGKHIVFEVNDLLDNVLITYNYDNKYDSVELVNFLGDENYLLLEHKYLNINPKEQIDEFLNNLKKNLIVGYEGGYITHCEIIASEKHIKQLISRKYIC